MTAEDREKKRARDRKSYWKKKADAEEKKLQDEKEYSRLKQQKYRKRVCASFYY